MGYLITCGEESNEKESLLRSESLGASEEGSLVFLSKSSSKESTGVFEEEGLT